MIKIFPELYPDELLYSLFSRYHEMSGNALNISSIEELLANRTDHIDIEFVNRYNEDVYKLLARKKSIDEIISEHTMFRYYSSFLPKEKRYKAFSMMKREGKGYLKYLSLQKHRLRNLRYCPVCAAEDKKLYAEAYWHVSHQFNGVNTCVKHRCYLKDSSVSLRRDKSSELITAEASITDHRVEYCSNMRRLELDRYISKVVELQDSIMEEPKIGEFFHVNMLDTPYTSPRGVSRKIELLTKDINEFYKTLEGCRHIESWQLQKLFINTTSSIELICMLGLFLQIPAESVAYMQFDSEAIDKYAKAFDDTVKSMREQNYSFRYISEQLGMDVDYIKKLYHGKSDTKPQKKRGVGGKHSGDWTRIDKELLPQVEKMISNMKSENEKPCRVCPGSIERKLELPNKRLKLLPQCNKLVEQEYEPIEQFWARKVIWSVGVIEKNNMSFNWKSIRTLTNLSKENFFKAKPYLNGYCDEAMSRKLCSLI